LSVSAIVWSRNYNAYADNIFTEESQASGIAHRCPRSESFHSYS
jgi:hypothetical protein